MDSEAGNEMNKDRYGAVLICSWDYKQHRRLIREVMQEKCDMPRAA
jgi:hypothetical protein